MPTPVTPANNKANVSTTRGVVGGYIFSAALTATGAPTASTFKSWAPSTGWENLGYIPEDGFTEGVSKDGGDALRDINLRPAEGRDILRHGGLRGGLLDRDAAGRPDGGQRPRARHHLRPR